MWARASARAARSAPGAAHPDAARRTRAAPRAGWRAPGHGCRRERRRSPPLRSGADRSEALSGGELLPHAQRLIDVDGDDARYARLGHRHADELLGHLHRDLVVADEEELGLRGHALDEVAEATGVRVVQRRVHLVEQAERRRVELEQGEYERNGGEGFLAARQEMDARVPFARRVGHHLHAGVEDLLAGHDELRFAAPEERGEERPEMAVDALEGLAQELARLPVDAPDGVFESRHRLLEVGGLGVEEALALLARGELLERGEVHRAQLGDRRVDARDLALERRGSRGILRGLLEHRLVRVRLAQLAVELLEAELRRLLLQPQLTHALAKGIDARFDLQPRLFQLAQRAGRGFDRVARFAQRLLTGDARLHRRVERCAHRRNRIVGELLVEPRDLGFAALDLAVDELHRAVDLGDLGAAFAFAEERVLRLALGLLHGAALLGEGGLGLYMRRARRFQAAFRVGDLAAYLILLLARRGEGTAALLHLG